MDRREFIKGCASGAVILAIGACSEEPTNAVPDTRTGPRRDGLSWADDAGPDGSVADGTGADGTGADGTGADGVGADGADGPGQDAGRSTDATRPDSSAALDRGPLPIDPDGPTQYLSWDGGSGPTKAYWNRHLKLKWKNANKGDWLDADGVSQGGKPFAVADVKGKGPVSVEITALMARWLRPGKNRGAHLVTNQAYKFHFVGREGTDTSQRPVLEVETDQGQFKAPCICNAVYSGSTFKSFDTRAAFYCDSGGTRAIIQFDLTEVKGTLTTARLKLECTDLKYAGKMRLFEADPPTFRVAGAKVPAPKLGIAESYPFDKGLDTHASVLFASDFATVKASDWRGYCKEQELVPDPQTQSTYIRGAIPKGSTGGCTLNHNVVRGTATGEVDHVEKELYARYYVYLEQDWGSTTDANKMPGFDLRLGWWNTAQGGYWASTTGNGGARGSGKKVRNTKHNRWEYQGHSLRGHGGEAVTDGNPYQDLVWLGGYIYSLDQEGAFGTPMTWAGTVIGKERWACIEQHVKINSITGPYDAVGNGEAVADGIYRVWVDGALAMENTTMRWSRHPEMGIQGFWLNWYHGGVQPAPRTMHFRMNSVVIAKEYIGPRKV